MLIFKNWNSHREARNQRHRLPVAFAIPGEKKQEAALGTSFLQVFKELNFIGFSLPEQPGSSNSTYRINDSSELQKLNSTQFSGLEQSDSPIPLHIINFLSKLQNLTFT